ncbi:hypothetical protein BDV95DRAFT_216803 [Massariosphaeria phaeospora]|uniref:DH domain-containing protein n=1 Tax=Massariosphaeria phaeospora TaxID=100035 RepID=A0A7C8MG55_9PLEO|nr:hypothetical protein BDV95DRAFT_216803 [Massariosphaeria phaeospora]
MGEPEHIAMANYAYHPSVASWVHTTSLAQFDGTSDEAPEQSQDDFYNPTAHHPADYDSTTPSTDMAATRQRQQTTNGAVRSIAKPSVRSVSTPVTATGPVPRSTPQLPGNRPTVRSLASKFNQPSSTETSPSNSRTRPPRTSAAARSSTDASALPASASSSPAPAPARPTKEASYGSYKFNNLRPRERPQPAPATPGSARRTSGSRIGLDRQTLPSQRDVASPTTSATQALASSRQPFFGEVIGEHTAETPGYGIPSMGGPLASPTLPSGKDSMIQSGADDSHLPQEPTLSPASFNDAGDTMDVQQPEPLFSRAPRRRSPPSRIPVATQRMSAASDSSSSTRSMKTSSRPVAEYSRTSPTRTRRIPVPTDDGNARKSKPSTQPLLQAVSYRGYRERGKSPQGTSSGPSLAAVITAPLPPTSPRLRNSRERQLLAESPGPRSISADPHASQDYFDQTNASDAPRDSRMQTEHSVNTRDEHINQIGADEDVKGLLQPNQLANEQGSNTWFGAEQPLSIHTSSLHVPQVPETLSSSTNFEYGESPTLGMPGSFMMTPPIAQQTPPMGYREEPDRSHVPPPPPPPPEEELLLLQPRAFIPPTKKSPTEAPRANAPHEASPELGVRESIPIMLGEDDGQPGWGVSPTRTRHSPRLDFGAHKWREQPVDLTGVMSYLDDGDESPTDPFANRESLRPDDSASVAFYRQLGHRSPEWTPRMPDVPESGSLTLDSEAYSVINKVLNLYHQSESVTPEMAYKSRRQVQDVSPIIAQHKDWGSKEATETYLARLLSDAAGCEERQDDEETDHARASSVPSLSIHDLDEDPEEPQAGGTAIIYPPESRRYSRGSRSSTATTIYEDRSRPDSFTGSRSRDHSSLPSFAPHPPPKDWHHPADGGYSVQDSLRGSHDSIDLPSTTSGAIQLPEIPGAGEGLGLTLPAAGEPHPSDLQQHVPPYPPPRPPYSPPPPPVQPPLELQARPSFYSEYTSRDFAPANMDNVRSRGHFDIRMSETDPFVDSPVSLSRSGPASHAQPTAQSAMDPSAAKAPATKALRHRYRAMEEFVKTEHCYCIDMMVAHSIFEETAGATMTEKERKTLFCNSKEIEKASHMLYRSLKKAIRPVVNHQPPPGANGVPSDASSVQGYIPPDDSVQVYPDYSVNPYDEFQFVTRENDFKTNFGAIMMEFAPKLERLHQTYCLNFSDAQEYITRTKDTPEVLGWVMACFNHSKGLTNAWNLNSLLVKPCQRIVKYSLLLKELMDTTDPDHPDMPHIKAALEEYLNINERINAAKARQDTLRAATQEGKKEKNKGFSDRIGKTFVKALTSKADRTRQQTGAAAIYNDTQYEGISQKFGGQFFQIQIVIRDLDAYLDFANEFMCNLNIVVLGYIAMLESAPSSNPEIESTWRRWALGHFELQNVALEEHKEAVRSRVLKPITEMWELWGNRPVKLIEQRKKGLVQYVKYKQAVANNEKIDPAAKKAAEAFETINETLKLELPLLYAHTKRGVRTCVSIFINLQQDWYKTCSKKILPLLETEPEHTHSAAYDFKTYVTEFKSDFSRMEEKARSLIICNEELIKQLANNTMSPGPTFYATDDTSSRKSSSRRTESIGSDMSLIDHRGRLSNGYANSRAPMRSLDGSARSSGAGPSSLARERLDRNPPSATDMSDGTATPVPAAVPRRPGYYPSLDGTLDEEYNPPAILGSSYLSSYPSSSRTSGVFNSALPMSDSPIHPAAGDETLPATPNDPEELEVLFLAASLFEFNIAHDRREGGIPYLVYVPGEIFDVIGMKGELWLARNQDDPTKTVGWIWEKHFARILPEET